MSRGRNKSKSVFPTPVGVFLRKKCFPSTKRCLPHARGGVSQPARRDRRTSRSSPRPWGCFHSTFVLGYCAKVFPTPVGVFLRQENKKAERRCLPHARGGVSFRRLTLTVFRSSSPRPWGCFHRSSRRTRSPLVFPTPVGVFPQVIAPNQIAFSLPHARGGVSTGHRAEPDRL